MFVFQIGSAYRSFGNKLQYINHDEVQASALQIRKEIEELNRELFKKEVQNEILTDANTSDPMGYVCQKKIVHVKELQYLDKVVCTTTTGNLCYKVQNVIFFVKSKYVPLFLFRLKKRHILPNTSTSAKPISRNLAGLICKIHSVWIQLRNVLRNLKWCVM